MARSSAGTAQVTLGPGGGTDFGGLAMAQQGEEGSRMHPASLMARP